MLDNDTWRRRSAPREILETRSSHGHDDSVIVASALVDIRRHSARKLLIRFDLADVCQHRDTWNSPSRCDDYSAAGWEELMGRAVQRSGIGRKIESSIQVVRERRPHAERSSAIIKIRKAMMRRATFSMRVYFRSVRKKKKKKKKNDCKGYTDHTVN